MPRGKNEENASELFQFQLDLNLEIRGKLTLFPALHILKPQLMIFDRRVTEGDKGLLTVSITPKAITGYLPLDLRKRRLFYN